MGEPHRFKQGHKLATGRPKGSKNRLTNDVRECFHKVYEEMGANVIDERTGKPLTGHQAFLEWARDNQSHFYQLYAKMIPQTAELPGDLHEEFVDTLVFAEESAKLVDANAKVLDVTNEDEMGKNVDNQSHNGEAAPQNSTDNAPSNQNEAS